MLWPSLRCHKVNDDDRQIDQDRLAIILLSKYGVSLATSIHRQHSIESPIRTCSFLNWCYLLPKLMLRDSSCSDVIESKGFYDS